VDPREVAGVIKLLKDSGVESSYAVQCHFHFDICMLSGQEDPITSHGGSKRGGVCEITCAYFFS
jgi:hypothetical protein